MRIRTVIVAAAVAGGFVCSAHAAGRRGALELLQEQYRQRHEQFADEMEQLAAEVELSVLPDAAETIRQLIPMPDEQTLDVDALPEDVQPELPAALPDAERQWRSRLRDIRTDYARDLYRLSRQALNANLVNLAFQLVREVAFHDPDHRFARQLLGYVQYEDRWVTPFEQLMLRRSHVWHERFGWLPENHVERYEQGERFFRGRWISAEQEAALRHDFSNAWEVESDHFLIKTNQSLERGVALSKKLERFHRFFSREFAAVFDSPQQMRQLLEGTRRSRNRTRRHEIHYYQSKQEFVFRLREKQRGIEISNGLYLPSDRVAYFFYAPDDLESNEETLFHEVTHQLLSESQPRILEVGVKENFWLVEGIACYMESFEIHEDGSVSVGDPRHIRLYWARQRRLNENFYVPLARFTRLGMTAFQGRLDLETLQEYYSQATGLTHFFLHYEDGRYRDALIEHLAQIYSPIARVRTNPQPLDELTGVSFVELDRQYLSYLTEMQAALEGSEPQQQ